MINLLDAEHIRKQRRHLLNYLQVNQFNVALHVFELCERYHNGVRADKVTPEFTHQIQITLFLTTLPQVFDPLWQETVLVAALLHDLFEDYADVITPDEVMRQLPMQTERERDCLKQGIAVAMILSKIRDGQRLSNELYFAEIAGEARAALIKGADRINNFQSMIRVFSLSKQQRYLAEGMEILTALKISRRAHPELALAFYNIEYMLKAQIELISHSIDAQLALKSRINELAAMKG